jgi:signal transduction histidine kinase/ActR/RegA family two-component response regulator
MEAAASQASFSELDGVIPETLGAPPPRRHDLTWAALPIAAQLYVGTILAGGAGALAAFFPKSLPQPTLFAVLTLFACVTSLWKVNLPITPSSGSTLSVSYAANLMALLLLGPQQAVLVAIAGVWTQCTYKVKEAYPLYRTLFSVAAEVLTMVATGVVYQQLGGPTVPLHAAGLAKPLVGAIATYFVVNTGLVAGAIAVTTRRSFLTVWRDDFLWSGASFMVAGSAGAMAAVVVDRGEHWKAILLIAPIYLTYRTYELFVGRLEDNTRHMTEMRQLHQGTVDALTKARTAERAEQEARAAAERANRTKDEFLAVVSHELRTPLTSILGWADMLRRGRLEESRRERACQAIYDSARRQAKLIDDLLDVSRIMSGKLRLERTSVNINDVVDDAVQVVQPAADAKEVQISVAADPKVGAIHGDNARLQQVVSNLLSNALKFTPRGGSVIVQVTRSLDCVELQVRDSGQGIAPEFLSHVFEPFRQADGSTTRAHGGLGLGLSIVKRLVDAHHGTITATSEGVGRGASFIVRLPVNAAPTRSAYPAVMLSDSAHVESPSLNGLAVLVVDDDEDSRFVVAEHLSSQGAIVIGAASAVEAYEALRHEQVDVLLADIAMPEEDGYTLIRRIRGGLVPACAAIPAAALTAFAREDDRQLALSAGFQMHLVKPVDSDALIGAVARLGRPTGAAPRSAAI